MSTCDRLHDAQLLHQNGRFAGALLNVLVAIAATSRKRRPRPVGDKEAFTRFVAEETLAITGGAVKNFNLKYHGKLIPLQELLYTHLRCELAHEASIPSDIRFVTGEYPGQFAVKVEDKYVEFTETWMQGLMKVVQFAPENVSEFPDIAVMPDDVVKWFLFADRRESEHVSEYWLHRREFAA